MTRFAATDVRRAVILSAGQGRRLRPLTEGCPKCALPIGGRALIEWQIDALLAAGIDRIHPVLGYGADEVEAVLARRYPAERVAPIYNPFYDVADNLGSCWLARHLMTEDFLLLNGDTLFEAGVLTRLLNSRRAPITLAVDSKDHYDADDMKVQQDGGRLLGVGKDLSPSRVNGESIGMLLFRDEGPAIFAEALDDAVRDRTARGWWYLWVINALARSGIVRTCSIAGLRWAELDFPEDLPHMEALVAGEGRPSAPAVAGAGAIQRV